jgi:hypothetical protein
MVVVPATEDRATSTARSKRVSAPNRVAMLALASTTTPTSSAGTPRVTWTYGPASASEMSTSNWSKKSSSRRSRSSARRRQSRPSSTTRKRNVGSAIVAGDGRTRYSTTSGMIDRSASRPSGDCRTSSKTIHRRRRLSLSVFPSFTAGDGVASREQDWLSRA